VGGKKGVPGAGVVKETLRLETEIHESETRVDDWGSLHWGGGPSRERTGTEPDSISEPMLRNIQVSWGERQGDMGSRKI